MEPEKKSNGALLGSIIIIIILIIGGIYIWQSKVQKALDEKAQSENVNTIDTNVDVDVNSIE